MRACLICAAVLLAAPLLPADDPTASRERRVRVALALAGAGAETCGKCREDIEAARKDAVAEQKPLVLFVGGPCGGAACEAEKAGAIPAKTPEYKGDDRPAGEPRIVVLEPKPDKSGLWLSGTLPAKSDAGVLTRAVQKATPAKGGAKKLDWEF